MPTLPKTALPEAFPAQQAYLAIEQPPANAAEKRCLAQVRRHVLAHPHTQDLRELAGAVKKLLGPAYEVGCGSAHIWVKRPGDPERLAIVADRLTTAYRDWFEPRPPREGAANTSRNPHRRLALPG
ncbi:hypothetical protein ACFQ48_18530 [Hymenobacter caeli]|uniref:Uncharacterized protein n=1 Tax=Hymenobacter caeli TaxID=2735894 RepID=A0ABX2FXD3_9BACT|nr:hypothetical protein [Hymenobacter caeli]NRT20944.1 hypothetical protein [Hymenobacter caeli]